MDIKFYKFYIVVLGLFFTNKLNSQTTTINYLTSSLSTSSCSVFNPSVAVAGQTHRSLAGGVTFNTTNGLTLTTTPQASSPGGTAYSIQ